MERTTQGDSKCSLASLLTAFPGFVFIYCPAIRRCDRLVHRQLTFNENSLLLGEPLLLRFPLYPVSVRLPRCRATVCVGVQRSHQDRNATLFLLHPWGEMRHNMFDLHRCKSWRFFVAIREFDRLEAPCDTYGVHVDTIEILTAERMNDSSSGQPRCSRYAASFSAGASPNSAIHSQNICHMRGSIRCRWFVGKQSS